MTNSPMVLDHVDGLSLNEAGVQQHGNELNSLAYLSQGLGFLNAQVHRIEGALNKTLDPDRRVMMFGNHPAMKGMPQGLVASAFHWYAVSACNYVRLVGWLTHQEQPDRAREYVKRVMPSVYRWRNKVGAHFARTDPKKEDSFADLIASVMFPIAFDDDAFWTGVLSLALTRRGQASHSRSDMRWSLTHTHRGLAQRYWPDQILIATEAKSKALPQEESSQ